MSEKAIRRFYTNVSVGEQDGRFVVLLDGKPAKTPHRALLVLPTKALAEAVAMEWRTQEERLDRSGMMLTQLACVAIDFASGERGKVVGHATAFGRSDLLCYRAEAPESLAARQKDVWDPLLAWARESYGLRLNADAGIVYTEQPADALLRMQELVSELDVFPLAAFDAAATDTGSFVLALALLEGRIDAQGAYAAALIEELYQAETWGRDAEAETRRSRLRARLGAIERFSKLLRA